MAKAEMENSLERLKETMEKAEKRLHIKKEEEANKQ